MEEKVEETVVPKKVEPEVPEGYYERAKTPRGKEMLGVLLAKLGYGKFRVLCSDMKERICRVPGSKRRRTWLRNENIILVVPWEIQGDIKGDIIYRYSAAQARWLDKNGYLKKIKSFL